jgi:hypothetical protein
MKTSVLERNGVSRQVVELISRMVDLISWPERRQAMGDAALTLLDGKPRVAEDVFGWSRTTVALGIDEFQSGITCVNDLGNRRKPKSEEKNPKLLDDIHHIMNPHSQADPQLRTTLLYTDMTAQAVYNALLQKGWDEETLPKVRTISNILQRHDYRLRTVVKTKVQKKPKTQPRSSRMSGE